MPNVIPVRKTISTKARLARLSPEDQATVAHAVNVIAKQREESPTVILENDDPDYSLEPDERRDIELWRQLAHKFGVN